MLILSLRTDRPQARIALYEATVLLDCREWQAHRQLAVTIHRQIDDLLSANGRQLGDIKAVVLYAGPGSFTGLRIGASVANALAYSLGIAVVTNGGSDWEAAGIRRLLEGQNSGFVVPDYGALPGITTGH